MDIQIRIKIIDKGMSRMKLKLIKISIDHNKFCLRNTPIILNFHDSLFGIFIRNRKWKNNEIKKKGIKKRKLKKKSKKGNKKKEIKKGNQKNKIKVTKQEMEKKEIK